MPVVIDSFDVVPDSSAPASPAGQAGQAGGGAAPSDLERALEVERAIALEQRRQARVRAH